MTDIFVQNLIILISNLVKRIKCAMEFYDVNEKFYNNICFGDVPQGRVLQQSESHRESMKKFIQFSDTLCQVSLLVAASCTNNSSECYLLN